MKVISYGLIVGLLIVGIWYALHSKSVSDPELSGLSITEKVAEQARLAEEASLPSHRLIANSDLPPQGTRSLFDHHVARLGELPYPFSALLDSFKPLDRWNQGSVSLLIPDGRSLAKSHADYRYPRVLVAAQLDPLADDSTIPPIYSGRLFLGFVEAINTVEIISYNEAAGRFEFQLVENYCAGCTPRITYAKRAICMACHQSGSPIFAVRPWSETNANREVAERIAAQHEVSWSEAHSTPYQGVPISTQIVMPETFDELVGHASDVTLAQRVWIDGCGEDGLQCRRELLAQVILLLLKPGNFNPDSAASNQLRSLQQASWPANGIAVQNDRLPDRVPPVPSAGERWIRKIKNLWGKLFASGAGGQDSSARLAAFERLPGIPVTLDPLTTRPPERILDSTSLEGVHALSRLFSPRDRDMLLQLTEDTPERLQKIILSGAVDAFLKPAPLNRVSVLEQLIAALGQNERDYCCLDTSSFSPPVREDETQLVISPGSVLEVFENYCFACHRGNPVERLNFMAGGSEAEVLASIRATRRITEVLDYAGMEQGSGEVQLMPPPASEQRARLDAARARKSDDLQRMLDAVTSSR